ncbi:MAG: SRPBCC family protein [Bacteroidota bacterium]
MNTLITKEFDIEQPIEQVWASLANPEEIVTCVPGAAITEKVDDRNYKGEVVTKFGPIKAAYAGDIEIVELDEVNRKMVLKGRGLDSKGKGSADMIMNGTLSEADGKTHVNFSMDITIIGMLAQFGSRLINDVSDQLLNQFVDNFRDKLAAEAPAAPAASTAEEEVVTATATATETATQSTTTSAPKADNSFNAMSLVGTVIKSVLNSILDFFKSLFGIKKST